MRSKYQLEFTKKPFDMFAMTQGEERFNAERMEKNIYKGNCGSENSTNAVIDVKYRIGHL